MRIGTEFANELDVMKKHRKFAKQISDGFLARKALNYWRNLIANYDENLSDREFLV